MILLENSHYGDHQPGKTSQTVVIFKELMLHLIQLQKNSPIQLLLWEHVLNISQELMVL